MTQSGDQFVDMLRYAVGGMEKLRLMVRSVDGGKPEYFETDRPFAIIGRAKDCDVSLNAQTVAFRHAYLQVIGGRVACIDLLSPKGIEWDGPPTQGWLSPEHRIRIGDHWLQLFDDGWWYDPELTSPLDFKPRSQHRPEYGILPEVELQLANESMQGVTWPINRIITLLGRDERCRITCADEQISRVHCSFLLLPSGLWVIDLLGRGGVRVGGQPQRCALLSHGSELEIGRYRMRVQYPKVAEAAAAVFTVPPVAGAVPPVPALSGSDSRPSPEFLTRLHRVFQVETHGHTVIVSPQGDVRDFSYQEVQVESNCIIQVLTTYGYQHLVIDFSHVPLVGSVILDAIVSLCRACRGRAVMCGTSPEMFASLHSTNLPSIWPVYATRNEALHAVHL